MLRTGWILFAAGGVGDLVLHGLAHDWEPLQTPFGPAGRVAHLVTLAGMVLTVLGLCTEALRRRTSLPGERK